jgi:hypothetical protein
VQRRNSRFELLIWLHRENWNIVNVLDLDLSGTLSNLGGIIIYPDYATSRKAAGLIPGEVTGLGNSPDPSSLTMALGSSQPLTEMSTRNLPRDKGRPVREADNLTAKCEPIF